MPNFIKYKIYILLLFVTFPLSLLLFQTKYCIYKVTSNSMIPTLLPGDFVVAERFKGAQLLRKQDLLVFRLPFFEHIDPDLYDRVLIKRCNGISGEKVNALTFNGSVDSLLDYRKNTLFIEQIPRKGELLRMSPIVLNRLCYLIRYETHNKASDSFFCNKIKSEYEFGNNYYIVLGDNLDNSYDSRHWGYLPEKQILAKVRFVFFSIDEGPSSYKRLRKERFFKGVDN